MSATIVFGDLIDIGKMWTSEDRAIWHQHNRRARDEVLHLIYLHADTRSAKLMHALTALGQHLTPKQKQVAIRLIDSEHTA